MARFLARPVSQVAHTPNILAVYPGLPIKNVRELIAYAKANPGKLRYGSPGSGSSQHLSGELFNLMGKVDIVAGGYDAALYGVDYALTIRDELLAAFAVCWFLAYHRLPALVWIGVFAILITAFAHFGWWPAVLVQAAAIALAVAAIITVPSPLRRWMIGAPMLSVFRRILPQVSQTEREALEAGTVCASSSSSDPTPIVRSMCACSSAVGPCR